MSFTVSEESQVWESQESHMGCQRQLLGVNWQDHVKNTDIADMTGLPRTLVT